MVSGWVVEGAHGWAATRSELPGAASNPAVPASRRSPLMPSGLPNQPAIPVPTSAHATQSCN